jgi:hypothetical protein
MKPDEIAALAGVAQAIVAVATLVATVVVSVLVYIGTRKIARIEHDRGVRESWNTIDALALSDPSVLRLIEEILPAPGSSARDIEMARRKWLAYMLLNTLSSTYNGATRGLTRSKSDALSVCEYHVAALVRHDDIFALTQEGYSDSFAAFCKRVRLNQVLGQPGS